MVKMMYRVWNCREGVHEVLFETKKDAKEYVRLMNAIYNDENTRLNIYTWRVEVED